MKCPECNHNQLRGQHGMTCRQCSYEFIFDPKRHFCGNKNMTDGYFIKCIDQASRNNSYFYTKDELYCYMARKTKTNIYGCLFLSFILIIVTTVALESLYDAGLWLALILIPLCAYLIIARRKKALSYKVWEKLLTYWQKRAKKYKRENVLAGLLCTPQLNEQPASQTEPDIYDYGASKLLICQHELQVDWLVMNQYHARNGIVVIAENGYPHYLTERVSNLVASNPNLKISLLHNASITGESMVTRVLSSRIFGDLSQHSLIDLGLNDTQLQRLKIPPNIIDQYNGDFPAHALNYHNFNRLITHSISNSSDFDSSIIAFESSSDFGEPCDFG